MTHLQDHHGMDVRVSDVTCPLCVEFTSGDRDVLSHHVARHMEEIALAILPSGVDSDEESADDSTSDAKVRETALAETHPDRLASQHELASAYHTNGQTKEAVSLLEHVVRVKETTLAETHPDRLASQHELASAYHTNGQTKEAVSLLEHVVRVKETTLAETHPDRVASQHELARAYQANGQTEEGMALLEHVLKLYRDTLGTKRKDTITCMIELVGIYMRHHKWDQAERLLMEAGPLCRTKEHLCEVGDCLYGVFAATGRQKEGLEELKQVLAMRKTLKGVEEHVTLRTMSNLAAAHADLGQVQEAVNLAKEVVDSSSRIVGKEHPDTLHFKSNLGAYMMELGQLDEAAQVLRETWTAECRIWGEKHEYTLSTMYKGARAMYKKGEYQDAAKTVGEYIRLMTEAYGVDYPRVVQATKELEEWKQISGESARSNEGEELEKTSYKADQARSSKATSLG